MTNVVPSETIKNLADNSRSCLYEATNVEDSEPPIDSKDLKATSATWLKYKKVFAVFADLKGSTKLKADNMWDKSTASIYDAAIEPMARIFGSFDADFIAIQGDGGFALYTGELAAERGLCAAITLLTFSKDKLAPLIEERWKNADPIPESGFKVGAATSDLLGRKVGIPGTEHNAPVWAGRAVNYAAKASQQAGVHNLLVTTPVIEMVNSNDFLCFSCGCSGGTPGGTPKKLWEESTTIKHVGDKDNVGAKLSSTWCMNHGDDFCAAILDGETRRDDTKSLRSQLTMHLRATG